MSDLIAFTIINVAAIAGGLCVAKMERDAAPFVVSFLVLSLLDVVLVVALLSL